MRAAAVVLRQNLEPAAGEGLQEWQGLRLRQGVDLTSTQRPQQPGSLRRCYGQRSPGAYSYEQSEPAFTPTTLASITLQGG